MRRVSLDQFRGYTVLGMICANFLQDAPFIIQHFPFLRHAGTGFGYSDSIMPQFFFAVGFAFRLTFLRRTESQGWLAANLKAIRRSTLLLLLGLLIYGIDIRWAELQTLGLVGFFHRAFQREFFQTITHIGLTALWVLPVIAFSWRTRLIYCAASLLVFSLLSHSFYFAWAIQRPVIDGGPLGFLSWTAPLLAGAWAYDVIEGGKDKRLLPAAAVGLMLIGSALAQLGEGSRMWVMSQRAGSVSYQVFGAGFSLLVYSFFVWVCDVKGFQSGFLNTFGMNALAAYILDGLVSDYVVGRWIPPNGTAAVMIALMCLQVVLCYLILRVLEKNRLFLRL